MDLKTYEQIKFELAELIRSGQFIASEREQDPNGRYDAERPWRTLLTRLAEDRFTVVVAGRFSRGKSSLMNAVPQVVFQSLALALLARGDRFVRGWLRSPQAVKSKSAISLRGIVLDAVRRGNYFVVLDHRTIICKRLGAIVKWYPGTGTQKLIMGSFIVVWEPTPAADIVN